MLYNTGFFFMCNAGGRIQFCKKVIKFSKKTSFSEDLLYNIKHKIKSVIRQFKKGMLICRRKLHGLHWPEKCYQRTTKY
ncbi:hypothetical protein BACI71_30180 [Bacillus mycoides]|uniref:Uncharacterized protein n=1 Tax=Bacillus mycoides TaxID=1405 RepID=A0A653WIV8_BACMY|nr:hypothetical protein BACI71_30180 [Bacillus mycoides]